jgi:protein-L-isoaspartate(D-aspartate) O-methyltransferase
VSSIEEFRRFYARFVTAKAGVSNERVIAAFASVEREHYAGPGPWLLKAGGGEYVSSECDDPRLLYQDALIALAPESGINNGEPSLHAKCLAMAGPRAGEVVVHVGAGAGYYTAILAQLVAPTGFVHAYEIELELARRASANLYHLPRVEVHAESALKSLPPADVIYLNAGTTHPPSVWLDALQVGGRMVVPLTTNDTSGCMLALTRRGTKTHEARIFTEVWFIPCAGARDEQAATSLKAALSRGGTHAVCSLHRGSTPDDAAWCIGDGWWLSTAELSHQL